MKRYSTTLILACTLVIGELHTFWEKASQEKVNWIIKRSEPMTMQWNIKMVGDEINIILYFVAMLLFGFYPNRTNTTSVISFIYLAVADLCLWFWNFKTYDYHILYLTLLAVWPLTFYLLKFKR